MATFVLVHGAWHGAWCWRRVARLLARDGHEVFAPTLTGLGERSHLLAPGINLDTHILDVANEIKWQGLKEVILVGHSYGGMVISGVAEKMPEKIKSFVVIDGFVPENGKAMREYWPASIMGYLDKEASKTGGVSVPALPAESLAVAKENRAWVDGQTTPQPYATFNEVIRLGGARDRIAKKSYIRASKFRSHPFDAVVKRLEADPSWQRLSIESGHVPMVDHPSSLACLLAQTA